MAPDVMTNPLLLFYLDACLKSSFNMNLPVEVCGEESRREPQGNSVDLQMPNLTRCEQELLSWTYRAFGPAFPLQRKNRVWSLHLSELFASNLSNDLQTASDIAGLSRVAQSSVAFWVVCWTKALVPISIKARTSASAQRITASYYRLHSEDL